MSTATGSVAHAVGRVRSYLRALAVGAGIAWALAVVGAVLLVSWGLAGPDGWAETSPIPLLILVLGVFLLAAGVAVFTIRFRAWGGEGRLTRAMERSSGVPEGSVRAQLELSRSVPSGASSSLTRAGEARLVPRLVASSSSLSGELGAEGGRLFRAGSLLAGAVLLLVLGVALTTPERTRTAWAGLAHPVAKLRTDPLPPLVVEPGDAWLPRGTRPEVRIQAPGRDSVLLHWQAVGEVGRAEGLRVRDGRASTLLPPLEAEVIYWAEAPDGARSAEARISPQDPALLSDVRVEVRFPPHTRLLSETHAGSPPPLSLPEGTTLRIGGRMQGEGQAVLLRSEAGGASVLRTPVVDGRFAGVWRPLRSTTVGWEVEGALEGGFLPPSFSVEVTPDLPPDVQLTIPREVRELPASLRLPIELQAADDFGIAWVEIEVTPRSATGSTGAPVIERIPTGDRPRVALSPLLDVSSWGLDPGSELVLRARAADNAPVTKISESPPIVLRVPSAQEIREEARTRIEAGNEGVAALLGTTGEEAEALRDLARRLAFDAGSGDEFRNLEEARAAAERHARSIEALASLAGELGDARAALGGTPDDETLANRIRELERMLHEAVSPEARQRVRDLMEGHERGEASGVRRSVEDLMESQEALREALEEVLEQMRRIALEEAFRGVEEELHGIADAQGEVADALREGAGTEGQDHLAQRAEEGAERLEELARRLAAEGEMDEAAHVRRAGDGLESAREQMQDAAEAGARGDRASAGDAGDRAREAALDAARALEAAREAWKAEWEDQLRDSLHRGAVDALALARMQGRIREHIPGARDAERSALRAQEAALGEGVRNLATRLALATRQAPEAGRELSVALGAALDAVNRTLEALGGPGGGAQAGPYASAGQAQAALHRIALVALRGAEQVGESGQSELDRWMEEMESLASQQSSLNQETSALAEQMGAMGADGSPARMEALAALQEALAAAMGAAGETPGRGEGSGQVEAMAAEASELAEALGQGRLVPELLDRQRELLDRLLDATRGLERDGESDEREGRAASRVERRAVAPLPEELLRSLAIPLPTTAELEALSPAERRLVLEYFDRLNRSGGRER